MEAKPPTSIFHHGAHHCECYATGKVPIALNHERSREDTAERGKMRDSINNSSTTWLARNHPNDKKNKCLGTSLKEKLKGKA
jgi:hypothetical protein